MKVIKNKKIYTGEKVIFDGYIRFDRQIAEIRDMESFVAQKDDVEEAAEGDILIPGFIDIHSHGGYGLDNMDASPEEIHEMVHKMAMKGSLLTFAQP